MKAASKKKESRGAHGTGSFMDLQLIADYAGLVDGYNDCPTPKGCPTPKSWSAAENLQTYVNGFQRRFEETGQWSGRSRELRLCLFYYSRLFYHWGEIPRSGEYFTYFTTLFQQIQAQVREGDRAPNRRSWDEETNRKLIVNGLTCIELGYEGPRGPLRVAIDHTGLVVEVDPQRDTVIVPHDGQFFEKEGISRRLKLSVGNLLEFFDTIQESSVGHVSPIVSILGEDLGAGAVQHFLRSEGRESVVLQAGTPTGGAVGTKRLDRWILVENGPDTPHTLYQVEIKNWSASAIGGKRLEIDANEEALSLYRKEFWSRYWNDSNGAFASDNLQKVLHPMKLPRLPGELGKAVESSTVIPMLCFWRAVHPEGKPECMFQFELPSRYGFPSVAIFSISNYLRFLRDEGIQSIWLDMPATARRLEWLEELIDIEACRTSERHVIGLDRRQ